MEKYRSGRNEPHSKCGCPLWAHEFESHLFRQKKAKPKTAWFFYAIDGLVRTH